MEEKSLSRQQHQVLEYIEQFGSITPLDALEDLGIYRLSARIKDLRELGYPIVTTMEYYFENGIFKKYARYSIKK